MCCPPLDHSESERTNETILEGLPTDASGSFRRRARLGTGAHRRWDSSSACPRKQGRETREEEGGRRVMRAPTTNLVQDLVFRDRERDRLFEALAGRFELNRLLPVVKRARHVHFAGRLRPVWQRRIESVVVA